MSVFDRTPTLPLPPNAQKQKRYGGILLIEGPMFAGKSTELILRMRRFAVAEKNCLLINHSTDVRYDSHHVVTHDQQKLACFSCSDLSQVENVEQYDCVGIDEGQFFPDLNRHITDWAARGVMVMVAALSSDFRGLPFPAISQLVPDARYLLHAVCMDCHQPAAFSKRLVSSDALCLVGGKDMYKAVCRTCFYSPHDRSLQ